MPAKPKATKSTKVKPTIREVTEIRFCEAGADVNFDVSSEYSDYFIAKINSKGNVEVTAPCGDDFEFAVDTIKQLVKLLGL